MLFSKDVEKLTVTPLLAVGTTAMLSTVTFTFLKNTFWLAAPDGDETFFVQET